MLYILDFGMYEVLKVMNDKNIYEKEFELIISSLEEAIITRTDKNFGFCNKLGIEILKVI